MIIFKTLRWKNLLSTGNQFTEIDLNRSRSTLIVGKNGSGKSTLIESLMFVLYGRPYRDINKPQLVNSITNKNMLVELEFSIGQKNYFIRRGMKPNIFEIYLDGKMLEQDSSVKDYQEQLEKNILKIGHKSCRQIVVLGSANYVPFMQLDKGERRQIIEDLLDIQIFSLMNSILKEKINTNKLNILNIESDISLLSQKIDLNQKHVESLRVNNQQLIDSKKNLLTKLSNDIETTQEKILNLNVELSENLKVVEDYNKNKLRKDKLVDLEKSLETKKKALSKEILFFTEKDNCPTCKQEIDTAFKLSTIDAKIKKQDEVVSALTELEAKITDIESLLEELSKVNETISTINRQISNYNSDIHSWNRSIDTLKEEIKSIENNTNQIDISKTEVKDLERELRISTNKKKTYLEERDILEISSSLLKDTGIKTRIIKQYIPIINKLVNKYLASLDFFVNFELDEKFNEVIKSRFRDEFSYNSFSQGEKFRIDLALLLTWRTLSKLRNSASTNLLIMDEVFDGAADGDGVEGLVEILDSFDSSQNIFIISHNEKMVDKFENVIKFEKVSNFSRIAK